MKYYKGKTLSLLTILALAGGFPAEAAPAVPEPGDSLPRELPGEPEIANELNTPATPAKKLRFTLKKIKVEQPKESRFDQESLDRIAAKSVGREISVEDLDRTLAELSAYGRNHGYPAAYAFIPEQKAKGGELLVKIALGRFGKVNLSGDVPASVLDRAEGLLAGLKNGDIIKSRPLETALYNVNSMYGFKATGALVPGDSEGLSDMNITLSPGKRSTATVYADNYGSIASGRYRYGFQAGFLGVGDTSGRLTVGGLISNANMHNYNVGWDMMLGHSATNIGIRHSRMDYELGGVFKVLEAKGIANTTSLYGSTAFWRSAASQLALTYGFDYRTMTDEMEAYGLSAQKHSHSFHIGLEGTNRPRKDSALYGSLTLYRGQVNADSDWGRAMGEAANTLGHYYKGVMEMAVLQKLGGPLDLYARLQHQEASRNLDSSEQIYLGGAHGVRAYPTGECSGDRGTLFNLELHYKTKIPGLMLRTYYDVGNVRGTKDGRLGNETLQGWGIGLTYTHPDHYFLRLDYARRIGLPETASENAKSRQRIWFLAGKTF